MGFVLTKNNLCELNVFFYKKNFTNIHRPKISYLKVDNYKSSDPVFHIGFHENMGYLDSVSVTAGVMIFEVLEGYPLQSLLFFNNDENYDKNRGLKYRLEDLEPMDFFCVQNTGQDPYGDFILRDLKFISTKMEQGIQDAGGRKLVAHFVCKEMKAFRIPYFYNHFKSDNYEYHIVRNKKEIADIRKDIIEINGQWDPVRYSEFRSAIALYGDEYKDLELDELLQAKWDIFSENYRRNPSGKLYSYKEIIDIKEFIKVFYRFKNELAAKEVREDSRFEFLRFIGE